MTRPGGLGFDLLCLAAGLVLPLAFAPWALYPLAWAALIPLLVASDDPRPGRRFRRGLGFGLGLFGFGLYWLLPTIHTFGHMPLALAVPTWVLLVAYCALYPALFALLGGWFGGPTALRYALVLPLLWVGLEAVRGWAFTGFPWLSLGASQAPGPLGGWLPVAGSLGTGLV
ncbi:MAG: apolipoprotein N-acyltransferase, partial [Thiohalorhabdaceae bacterium]